jgi:hypothetical protein
MASQASNYLRSLNPRTTSAAIIATAAALTTTWILIDYYQWTSFGTGGTPPTPSGYWRMTKLRWKAFRSGHDLRDASVLTGAAGPQFLPEDLPTRAGPRPKILSRTMPQRQQPEPLDSVLQERLQKLASTICSMHSDILTLAPSKTEGFSADAIYAHPALPGRHPSAKDRILGDEIAHVHPAENSLHVWLSGPDAKMVVEKGWGERFPLSAMGMCHQSWVMVYAPRDERELEVVEQIVKAGIGYLTGMKI